MTRQRQHLHYCSLCGSEVWSDAKHHARLRTPCLPCLRKQSGWTPPQDPHDTAEDPDHVEVARRPMTAAETAELIHTTDVLALIQQCTVVTTLDVMVRLGWSSWRTKVLLDRMAAAQLLRWLPYSGVENYVWWRR